MKYVYVYCVTIKDNDVPAFFMSEMAARNFIDILRDEAFEDLKKVCEIPDDFNKDSLYEPFTLTEFMAFIDENDAVSIESQYTTSKILKLPIDKC